MKVFFAFKVSCLTTVAVLLSGSLLFTSPDILLPGSVNKLHQRAFSQPDTSLDATWAALHKAPFAFVNQPWDWVEGYTTAGATVQATLLQNSDTYTTQTVADSAGWFALQFVQNDNPIDILEGDRITVSGGVLDASIDVVAITGTIHTITDTVSGQVSGGVFPATGMVGVGRPSDTVFATRTITIAVDGTYLADFSDDVDVRNGYVAQIWYTDPDGNQVRKIIYSDGLDVRTRVTEDLIEGVAMPDTTVQVTVRDGNGAIKGTASVVADRTGYYVTRVITGTSHIDIAIGDKVTVAALETLESMDLDIDVHHESRINPDNDTVSGQLSGCDLPASGRVDLWHAEDNQWYYQDVQVDEYGYYRADFSDVVDMKHMDRIRLWYVNPDGNQIAFVNAGLEVGVSTATDTIWGYTIPEASVEIVIRASPGGDIISATTVLATEDGFFEIVVNPSALDIAPGQEINATMSNLRSDLLIHHSRVIANFADQTISINGPPNAIFHVKLERVGKSIWMEAVADEAGYALVKVDPQYELQAGDRLDLTVYEVAQGHTTHQMLRLTTAVFLPLVLKDA